MAWRKRRSRRVVGVASGSGGRGQSSRLLKDGRDIFTGALNRHATDLPKASGKRRWFTPGDLVESAVFTRRDTDTKASVVAHKSQYGRVSGGDEQVVGGAGRARGVVISTSPTGGGSKRRVKV